MRLHRSDGRWGCPLLSDWRSFDGTRLIDSLLQGSDNSGLFGGSFRFATLIDGSFRRAGETHIRP